MQRGRIQSFVEASWGSAAIFSTQPAEVDHASLVATDSVAMKTMSIMQDVEKESLHAHEISPRKRLSYVLSSIFATVMEDAVTKIRILSECNSELRSLKTKFDLNHLLVLKYNVKLKPCRDELEGIDTRHLDCEQYKIDKLNADRNYALDTIVSTYVDLCVNGSYEPLETAINNFVDRDNYRVAIHEDEVKNRILRRELYKQLRQRRNHIKSVIYETNQIIDKLKSQVEDSDIYDNCRSRYIDKWQKARTEQHIQSIDELDVITSQVVEYYKQRTEHEQRVHSEVDLLSNIIINETIERIEDWMAKYDQDIEKIDMKIRLKKNDYQNRRDIRLGLERTIEAHDKVMKDWCAFKEIREKARLYRERMNTSAIIVQSWWRGLLVRRGLGPYKSNKGPKVRGKK